MPFDFQTIPYRSTGAFSKTVLDYLEGVEQLKPFYKYGTDIAAVEQIIKDKSKQKVNRSLLKDVLTSQYNSVQTSEKTKANIESLESPKTFTITTAHQLNLFTGPLYVIYKIAAAINGARVLNEKYPDNKFIPVYWMGGEDHDFEEINHLNIYGKKVEWTNNSSGPVGRMNNEGLEVAINQLSEILGDGEESKVIIEELNLFFGDSKSNYGQSFFVYINHLFAHEGLVVLNGDDAKLKASFVEIMKGEIQHRNTVKIASETSRRLEENYKAQAHIRPVNLFCMEDGERKLIHENRESFNIGEYQYSTQDLIDRIEKEPEAFSPNVILRPLYQEFLLPNIAYIGGGGEMAYWLQLKDMFEFHQVNFPMLLLRPSAMILSNKLVDQWKNLGNEISDLFSDTDVLEKKLAISQSEVDLDLAEEMEALNNLKEQLLSKVELVDKGMKQSVEAELAKMEKSLSNVKQKLIRAQKKQLEVQNNKIGKLKRKAMPESKLQERYSNYLEFRQQYGAEFVPMLIEKLNPFLKKFTIITGKS